jgi:two-component system CheB/CheR fusion protein
MPMVMVLHELMTNAARFGALSTREGDVRLSWQVDQQPHGRVLEVHWMEEASPSASQISRRGLGSRLLQFAVAKGLNGVSEFNFEPDGLRVSISLPVG